MADPKQTTEIAPVALDVSGRTLAMITGGGLVAGALIVLGAIMPAEFNVDPLGLGKLTGIGRLWAPEAETFSSGGAALSHASTTGKTSHIVEISLGAAEWPEAAVEYKVHMAPGQSIFYKWTVLDMDGAPGAVPVEVDQHGHDVPPEGQAETVVEFRKERLLADQGSMTAPFDGIFGWYFKNHAQDPVTIRVEIEGFYDLVPPGGPGNEFNVRPLEPAPAVPVQ